MKQQLILSLFFLPTVFYAFSQDNWNLFTKSKNEIPLIVSKSLEQRKDEFRVYINAARKNIDDFVKKNDWIELTSYDFFDSVLIFDDKKEFDRTLLKLTKTDTLMKLPKTYCAALEQRKLIVVSPEIYAEAYPDGIEERSYEKLLTHEIAHRLHIGILKGDEEAMGPVWFYEGFAMYVANQFEKSNIYLNKEEMIKIMNDPNRGSYKKYNFIFKYFVDKISLDELIQKAKNKNFNNWLISKIN